MQEIDLFLGDCLDVLPRLLPQSIDLVLCDPPYGTTACKWDSIIPLDPMWEQLKRVTKPTGAIVIFGCQPFTTTLISSNLKGFKYELIYEKTNAKGFLSAKYRPLTAHENILIFGKAKTYNPQKWIMPPHLVTKRKSATRKNTGAVYGDGEITRREDDGSRHPTSVIGFSNRAGRTGNYHPTQKPLELMKYLVNTYSNENDTILDFCMGSGTTGVACKNLNRNFIGIELDSKYYEIAKQRISDVE